MPETHYIVPENDLLHWPSRLPHTPVSMLANVDAQDRRFVFVVTGGASPQRARRVVMHATWLRHQGVRDIDYVSAVEPLAEIAARGEVELMARLANTLSLNVRMRTAQAGSLVADADLPYATALDSLRDEIWVALLAQAKAEDQEEAQHAVLNPAGIKRGILQHKLKRAVVEIKATQYLALLDVGDLPDLSAVDMRVAPFIAFRNQLCLVRKDDEAGRYHEPFTNFAAFILRSVTVDDGSGLVRSGEYEIAGILANGKPLPNIIVTHDEFDEGKWLTRKWPSGSNDDTDSLVPVVNPQVSAKTLAAAIKTVSGHVQSETRYERTGWILHGGQMIYAHSGGAIGKSSGIRCESNLENVDRFVLPSPDSTTLADDWKAVIGLLDLHDLAFTSACLGAAFYAPLSRLLGHLFYVWVWGKTGSCKTSFAALLQALYGAQFSHSKLLAYWGSTPLAVQRKLSVMHDCLVVTDNYLSQQANEQQTIKFLHSIGDGQGRSRLKRNGEMQGQTDVPHSTMLATGEQPPPADEGAWGRGLIVHVPSITKEQDRHIQEYFGKRDALNRAMAGFIEALLPVVGSAAGLQAVRQELADLTEEAKLRLAKAEVTAHSRSPQNVAAAVLGVRMAMRQAAIAGAIEPDAADALIERMWAAVLPGLAEQAVESGDHSHSRKFLELLEHALHKGTAKLVPIETPVDVAQAQGAIGWYDQKHIYLRGGLAYSVAKDTDRGWRPGTKKSLWLSMANIGLARETPELAKKICGQVVKVVWLLRDQCPELMAETADTGAPYYEDDRDLYHQLN